MGMKVRRAIAAAVVLFVLVLAQNPAAAAEIKTDIRINGQLFDAEETAYVPVGNMGAYFDMGMALMGFEVQWNDDYSTVEIDKEGLTVPAEMTPSFAYTYDDIYLLAKIVRIEGYDLGYNARLAIANVVLNRAKGNEYPDTIAGVIYDTAYAVQFPPAHRDSFSALEPDELSITAAKNALMGENNVGSCLYFNNSPFRSKADDLHTVIEGEYFYF